MRQLLSLRRGVVLVFFFLTNSAFAKPHAAVHLGGADLTLSVSAAATYNAGEVSTLIATVTNLGPGTATAAGVRLPKISSRTVGAERFGCLELPDSVLCNTRLLAAGESHRFNVPFIPPDAPGPITLTPRTESFTIDPNHGNNTASVNADVVAMVDLITTFEVFPSLQPGEKSQVAVRVTNAAALPATAVTAFISVPASLQVSSFASPNCKPLGGDLTTYACSLRDLDRGATDGGFITVTPPAASSSPISVTARAESAQPEWNPADNRVTRLEPVEALADLTFSLSHAEKLDGDNRVTLNLTMANTGDVTAKNVSATISFASAKILSTDPSGWTCVETDSVNLRCTIASLDAHVSSTIAVRVQYPTPELRAPVFVTLAQLPVDGFKSLQQVIRVDAVFFRSFDVTTTADSGPGSLRQAIIDANAQCSGNDVRLPCRVAFRIPAPVPASGWFTFEPLSPLPPLTVTDLTIDGETQTSFTGDTNSHGPEVFLLGDKAGDGDGLHTESGLETIRGLAIGGFAQNAILSLPRPNVVIVTSSLRHLIERNYLGLDPTGTRAVPNGLRGFSGFGFHGDVRQNVISGNTRSGISLAAADDTAVTNNRIGVAAATDDPVPNGASGIFFTDTTPFFPVKVEGNVIEFNHDFGIALAQNSRIEILDNVIAHNLGQAIDLGMDGPTAGSIDGPFAPLPAIAIARYDAAAGETVIEGSAAASGFVSGYLHTATVYLYVNEGAVSEGQIFLGTVITDTNGRFVFRTRSDLRSKYIDATTDLVVDFGDFVSRTTSEFGLPSSVMAQ